MRPLMLLSVFTAGLATAIVASAFAVSEPAALAISANEEGAWITRNFGNRREIEFCWIETLHPSTDKVVKCTGAGSPE